MLEGMTLKEGNNTKIINVSLKDKEELSQGTFISAEYYDAYVDSVSNDEKDINEISCIS